MPGLSIEGGYNIRDLGGYPAQGGRATRPGVLIRAGNLDQVTAAGMQQLLGSGAKTIVDIRDEWEAEQYPDVFARSPAVKYANLPFFGVGLSSTEGWKARTQTFARVDELYQIYLEACQPQVAAIVTAIAGGEAAVVFHCHAGKDRTGLVSALLLGAAGIPAGIIAGDYAETNLHIMEMVAGWRVKAQEQGQDMEKFARDTGAFSETMIRTLDHLEQQYGGARDYLLQCGVNPRRLDDLLARFVS